MEQERRAQGWTERKGRRDVNITAIAYLSDGSVIPVKVTNISDEGCRIRSDRTLPIGDRLKLAVPRLGEISVQVRWSFQETAGVQFLLEGPAAD